MNILHLIILFIAGAIAGFINILAGGGSVLTLPPLIFLGLDSAVANGTNRISIVFQNMSAVSSFRHNQVHEFRKSMKYALFTLPGAILGAVLAIRISDELFQKILAVIMIVIVISMFISIGQKNKPKADAKPHWTLYPSLFGIGVYGGFIQLGVGFLLMSSLHFLGRMNWVRVNLHKVGIIFIYTMPALLVFIFTGKIHWLYGLTLAAGSALGGWWGAHATIRGGEKWIKIAMAVAILIMAAKLLEIY